MNDNWGKNQKRSKIGDQKNTKNTKNDQKMTFFSRVEKGPKMTIFDKFSEKLEKNEKKFIKSITNIKSS